MKIRGATLPVGLRSPRYRWVILGVVGLVLIILAACSASGQTMPTPTSTPPLPDKSEGILSGSVTIGPLCPVEPCAEPIDDVYASRELLLRQEGREPIRLPLRSDGTFQALIPAGSYMAELTNCEFLGCQHALPVPVEIIDGETATLNIDIDTGIRSPVGDSMGYSQLAEDLRAAGASVEAGGPITQPFFSVPGRFLKVNGGEVQVFEYPDLEEAKREAAQVAPDGSSVGTTMITWVASPHFYMSGTLIVLYVGDDAALQTLLEEVLGSQFAGISLAMPGQDPVPPQADLAARSELGLRLGIDPDEPRLVNSEQVEFRDGGLGCPEPGVSYPAIIVPGSRLLYEHEALRYPYHVSMDGSLITDCRRETTMAIPFRLADEIVTVKDAFRLVGEAQSGLGREVVLRTLSDAQAFQSRFHDSVEIELDQIDWDAQMLVGTVVVGTGCSFEVWVPGVFDRHSEMDLDIEIRATQIGLCERLWAQPIWLIIEGIPSDYSAGFTLNFDLR